MRVPFLLLPGAALLIGAATVHGQYALDTTSLPSGVGADNASSTENVDFGDVDLDGDWDVAVADGGDDGNDQNRLWINNGGLQAGALGTFADETVPRLPVLSDDSRDIEFADIDGDGDLDLYTANTAQISNQGNRWWVNAGGEQGGTPGFYQDETAARWVGLGGAGSSLSLGQLVGGTFIDWSCDCDFGDLDDDGDLDLVHTSYGGAFGGGVPTRLFLNDGAGFFTEFNPAGVQLFTPQILGGTPALWCEGVQTEGTSDATGAQADIATTALDVEVADLDGDLDLDLILGARDEAPRMFRNRLEENGGVLAFRDVTGAVFPAGYATGFGHYEQELGDLDGDGDLDLYGLNWQQFGFFFNDATLENDGTGVFGTPVPVPSSFSDDNEVDFVDYDNDGDLDVYVANFTGQDKLYRNDPGGVGFNLVPVALPAFASVSLDADACDVDGDGDYDLLVAEDDFAPNTLLENVTGVGDTSAPWIPLVESVSYPAATGGDHVVRAHVLDNTPYYLTWYDTVELRVAVDGVDLPALPMPSSMGQVFRGELPANLVGSVVYEVRARDPYGNEGVSAPQGFVSNGTTGTLFGTGSAGTTLDLRVLSEPREGNSFHLLGEGTSPGAESLIAVSLAPLDPPLAVPGNPGMVLNISVSGPNPVFTSLGLADGAGRHLAVTPPLPPGAAGFTLSCQFLTKAGIGGDAFMSSEGLSIDVLP